MLEKFQLNLLLCEEVTDADSSGSRTTFAFSDM